MPSAGRAGGVLTAKYRRGESPTDSRLSREAVSSWDAKHFGERADAVVDAIADVAAAKGCTTAQLSLAWLLAQPVVSSIVLGARTADQLAEQLRAVDVTLDDDDLARLDKISPPGRATVPYYLDDSWADFTPHAYRW